jgi:hypothetical protein
MRLKSLDGKASFFQNGLVDHLPLTGESPQFQNVRLAENFFRFLNFLWGGGKRFRDCRDVPGMDGKFSGEPQATGSLGGLAHRGSVIYCDHR